MIFYRKISRLNFKSFRNQKIENEIKILKRRNDLIVEILITAKDFLFYRVSSNCIEISNDLRILYNENDKLNPRGVFNNLQFASTIPPVSLFEEISVFIQGFRHIIRISDFKIRKEPLWSWSKIDHADRVISSDRQKIILKEKLDGLIRSYSAEKQPLLLYSGGLDSNILAQRISKLNLSDPVLVHYAFDLNHNYTLKATSIAKAFNLPIRIINKGEFDEIDFLNKASNYYKSPVFDPSNMMISSLFNYISNEFDPDKYVVFTGDGADSVLFNQAKMDMIRYLNRIPNFLIYGIGSLYGLGNMYLHPSKLEKYIKMFKRAIHFEFYASRLAQNPLLNIAYYIDSHEAKKSEKDLENMLTEIYDGERQDVHGILLNLSDAIKITTYGIKSIFNSKNFSVAAVYEDMNFVDFAIQHMMYWPKNKIPKFIFKEMLNEDLPYNLSYIKKTYFSLPFKEFFGDERFLRVFEEVIEERHQMGVMLNFNVLKDFYFRCKKQKELPTQSYVFIWSLVILHQWLKNLPNVSNRMKSELM